MSGYRENGCLAHAFDGPLDDLQLDMPKEQIMANIETIIKDVCSHKPANFGTENAR